MRDKFIQALEAKIAGVFFISESEYPFTIEVLNEGDIKEQLAQKAATELANVKLLDSGSFISKVERSVSPGDEPLVANLRKIKELYAFLKENLSDIQVFRVEAGVQVPIYVVGALPDGTIAGVKTISVES